MATEVELLAKAFEELFNGNDAETTVDTFLDTGYPPLNYALSSHYDGGLPVGRIVEIFGPPSSGKTAIATCAMAAAQKMGGIAGFNDHERSFDWSQGKNLGLDIRPGKFVFKKPRTFEESLTICLTAAEYVRRKKLIKPEAPICWVFDSLASMVPQSKLFDKDGKERAVGTYNMHDNTALARATSAAMPAFNLLAEELGICVIFLNQMRTKPGVTYGDPTTTPGGDAPKFYASIRVQLGAKRISKGTGDEKEVLGQVIGCKVVKNKVSRPFLTASWRFLFQPDGTGKFDAAGSMIDFLLENKLLEGSGARVKWLDGKSYFKGALAEKIEKEGLLPELIKLLPAHVEPVVEIPDGIEGGWEEPAAA
jgi:recombination protein RecA